MLLIISNILVTIFAILYSPGFPFMFDAATTPLEWIISSTATFLWSMFVIIVQVDHRPWLVEIQSVVPPCESSFDPFESDESLAKRMGHERFEISCFSLEKSME